MYTYIITYIYICINVRCGDPLSVSVIRCTHCASRSHSSGAASTSQNTTFSEDDNVLVIGVSGEKQAIGYFGFSYYENNADRLRAVPVVNPNGEAILPSLETINSGVYAPLSRPLFIYVNRDAYASKPQVVAFIEFFNTEAVELIDTPEVGYVRLPDAVYARNLARLAEGDIGAKLGADRAGRTLAEAYGLP